MLDKVGFHLQAQKARSLMKSIAMEHFVEKRDSATGIPWPARGGEKKMGAAGRPWPGLAQAGLSGEKKTDSREAGIRFSPLRILFSRVGNGIM